MTHNYSRLPHLAANSTPHPDARASAELCNRSAPGSRKNHQSVGGGKIKLVDEFLAEILADLKDI